MKFYILTSRHIDFLKRHANTIPIKDQVVVINSLNDDYIDQASKYCRENSIEYYVTESDGTPATGKNSVMKVFLESDNEYMVQVDGDDTISEYGHQFYNSVAESEDPPDLIILYNQFQRWTRVWRINDITGERVPAKVIRNQPWTRPHRPYKPEDPPEWLGDLEYLPLPEAKKKVTLEKQYHARSTFLDWAWRHGQGSPESQKRDIFQRMVFYSRKAAELVHFDCELTIGEDTIAGLKMKEHFVNGDIKVLRNDEQINGGYDWTYLYNEGNGVVMGEFDLQGYEWYIKVMKYINKNNLIEKYKHIEDVIIPDII